MQVGPLDYYYINQKHDISWLDDGDVVRYKDYQYYIPVNEETRQLEQEYIVTANILLNVIINSPKYKDLVDIIFSLSPELFEEFTTWRVYDLLFGKKFNVIGIDINYPGIKPNDTSLEYALDTYAHSEMYTGRNPRTNAWQYKKWLGMNNITCCASGPAGRKGAGDLCQPLWPESEANTVRGSFGTTFHMFVDPAETLYQSTYNFGAYRSWPLVCNNVGKGPGAGIKYDAGKLTRHIGGCNSYTKKGISLLKYQFPEWLLSNDTSRSTEADWFNIHGPSGLLGIDKCVQFAPIFLSLPYFMNGSPELQKGVKGLSEPSFEKHGTWVGVEPITGRVMDMQFRMAANIHLQPTKAGKHEFYQNVSPVYLPLAWFDQRSTISDSQSKLFHNRVYKTLMALGFLRWGGLTIGILAFITAAILQVVSHRKYRKALNSGEVITPPSEMIVTESHTAPLLESAESVFETDLLNDSLNSTNYTTRLDSWRGTNYDDRRQRLM